jgi:hypothetical protein
MRRLLPLALLVACDGTLEDLALGEDGGAVILDAARAAGDAAPRADAAPDGPAVVVTADAGPCGPGEPDNDSAATAPALPGAGDGHVVCADDEDWYRIEPTAAGKLYVVGQRSSLDDGDLDTDLVDGSRAVLGASYINEGMFHEENGVGPTDTEVFTVVGKPGAAPLWLRVYGWQGAQNRYAIVSRAIDWRDGRCQDLFPRDECRAQAAGAPDPAKLIVFPITTADDPFLGRGAFTLTGLGAGGHTPVSRMWARRELIMILRQAIRAVQDEFPGTAPLGVGDISMPDGTTPEGHPNHTHDNGANIDFAYYIDPARHRAWGNLSYRQICCDAASLDDWSCVDLDRTSAGYGTCKTSSAHIVDVPRTAMVIAKIAGSGRLRVIGVEARVKAALEAELGRLAAGGKITAAERDAALARMASKDDHASWLWHFNHMHASFCAGDCAAKRASTPAVEGLWPDEPLDAQAERAYGFRSRTAAPR